MKMKRYGMVQAVIALGLALVIGGAAVADVKVRLRDGNNFAVESRDIADEPRFSVNRTGGPRFRLVDDLASVTDPVEGECVWYTPRNGLSCMSNSGWIMVPGGGYAEPTIDGHIATGGTGLVRTCGTTAMTYYNYTQAPTADCGVGYSARNVDEMKTLMTASGCSAEMITAGLYGCDVGWDAGGAAYYLKSGVCWSDNAKVKFRSMDRYRVLAIGDDTNWWSDSAFNTYGHPVMCFSDA